MKKEYFIPILAIIICSVLVATSFLNNPNQNNFNNPINSNNPLNYNSNICISTTGDFEGRESSLGNLELVQCEHNILYDTGAEAIEQYLGAGAGGGDAFDWIELCNASILGTGTGCGEPDAGKTTPYTAYALCGLSNVAGTYASQGNGNWSIYHTFTATCDGLTTNVTRLKNDDDDDLAGNSFTLVSLETDDQLLVNWTIYTI